MPYLDEEGLERFWNNIKETMTEDERSSIRIKSMTEEEYNSLTEEEKKNNWIYLVKDKESKLAGEIYSSEETVIGTWTDGRPLYRRVITSTVQKNDGLWYSLYPIIPNVTSKDMKKIIAWQYSKTDSFSSQCYGYVFGYNITAAAASGKTGVVFCQSISSYWIGSDMEITLEYTKSTDAPVTNKKPALMYNDEEIS